MTCRKCDIELLKHFALKAVKTPQERYLIEKIAEGGSEMAEVDILEILGIRGDQIAETAGGVATELYEDKITEKTRPYAEKISAKFAEPIAKLLPSVVLIYFAKRQGGELARALEAGALNLRWAGWADVTRLMGILKR